MEGNSSHAFVNPSTTTPTNTRSNANTTSVKQIKIWINVIGEYGRGMSAPSYHNMRVTLLKDVLEDTHKKDFGRTTSKIWTQCAAHYVNLILQDIGKKKATIATALTKVRAIVVYVYNHGRILNMMRKLTKNRELHRSCVTRFATQFYTLQSVHENRHHLQVLFVSEQWRKSDFAKKAPGKRVEKIVAKQSFWDGVYLACQIYAPLEDTVRLVDTEERPCMGYIYNAMSRAQDQISKNLNDGNNDKKRLAVEFFLSVLHLVNEIEVHLIIYILRKEIVFCNKN
ncbi:unnamed protein product [Lactuca saligna]|uniref:DUF659 domain-containing protein n=1 Tax=Lactuca saligna TaxID=75948 RepID=A0AA35Y0D1_LACSI|nr:unnamed protein product [Lactuca saligna]